MATDGDVRLAPGCGLSGFACGLYMRPNGPHPAGFSYRGHRHYIDHVTFIAAGEVEVERHDADGSVHRIVAEAPNAVPLPADSWHRITALRDGSMWVCVFSEALAEQQGIDRGLADASIPYEAN